MPTKLVPRPELFLFCPVFKDVVTRLRKCHLDSFLMFSRFKSARPIFFFFSSLSLYALNILTKVEIMNRCFRNGPYPRLRMKKNQSGNCCRFELYMNNWEEWAACIVSHKRYGSINVCPQFQSCERALQVRERNGVRERATERSRENKVLMKAG